MINNWTYKIIVWTKYGIETFILSVDLNEVSEELLTYYAEPVNQKQILGMIRKEHDLDDSARISDLKEVDYKFVKFNNKKEQ